MIMPHHQELDCFYVSGFNFLDPVSVVGYGEGLFYADASDGNHSLVWFFGRERLLSVNAFTVRGLDLHAIGSGSRKPPIGREPRFDPEKVHSPKSSVKKVAEREQIRSRGGRKVSGVSPRRIPKLDVAEVSRVSKN